MAQFIPSKKTLKDFNDGERYLNKIDVVQAQTVNNLVEGLLWAQENAGSGSSSGGGMSELDKQHLDSMWNIWSADGTTDTLVNKVEEVLSAFSSFREGDTIVELLSKKADKTTLDNYVTLDTEQIITGAKRIRNNLVMEGVSGDSTPSVVFTSERSGNSVLFNGNSFTTKQGVTGTGETVSTVNLPQKSGTLALTIDLDGLVSEDRLANVAFTGKYQDLVGAPTSGVHSVNGQIGDVIIDRDTLGLSDVALTGYYGDLIGTPDLSVYAKSADLSNYVTRNTKQYITGEKTFDDQIIVSDSDTLSARYGFNGISRTDTYGQTTHTYTFPDKSGTFLLDNDMPDFDNYVTLNTYQIIEAQKWFGNGITASHGITADDDSDMSATLNPDNITFFLDEEHVLSFPRKSGTLLIDSDLKGLVSEDRLANVAFTGKYQDLVGAPTSGVHSVNGQTGDVIIDRDTLGLSDVALTGYYGDLIGTPDLSVYAKSADLSNYVTRNTEQDIYGKKWFYGGIAFDNSSVRNGYVQMGDGKIIVGDSYGENEILFPQKSGTLALLSDIGSGNSGIDYETGEKYLGNNEYISLKAPPVGSKWLYIISCNIEGNAPPLFGLINIDGINVFPIESRFFADEQGAMNAEIKILVTRNAEGSNSFVIMCTGGTYYTTTEDFSKQDGTFGFGLDQDGFGWLEMQLSYICIK